MHPLDHELNLPEPNQPSSQLARPLSSGTDTIFCRVNRLVPRPTIKNRPQTSLTLNTRLQPGMSVFLDKSVQVCNLETIAVCLIPACVFLLIKVQRWIWAHIMICHEECGHT